MPADITLYRNGFCPDCKADLTWCRTTGREEYLAVDITPSDAGTVEVAFGRATVLTEPDAVVAREKGRTLFTAHAATCKAVPDAE
ncbi:hypothetical protein [Nocardia rhizosphaerae]|uniref:Glutathione-dependent formaldehyde-activating enzyme n=1 Tax=Nocardia rhizosphaerae TaxID=1691571 RepID=A0ABV8L3A4_9NOCA